MCNSRVKRIGTGSPWLQLDGECACRVETPYSRDQHGGGSVLILSGALMVSGVWTLWIYSMQALIGGFVLPI